mgnify:CR=1 FL=1
MRRCGGRRRASTCCVVALNIEYYLLLEYIHTPSMQAFWSATFCWLLTKRSCVSSCAQNAMIGSLEREKCSSVSMNRAFVLHIEELEGIAKNSTLQGLAGISHRTCTRSTTFGAAALCHVKSQLLECNLLYC